LDNLGNAYTYIGNTPFTHTDPMGLDWDFWNNPVMDFVIGAGTVLAEPVNFVVDVATLAHASWTGSGQNDIEEFNPRSMMGKSQVSRIRAYMDAGGSFEEARNQVRTEDAIAKVAVGLTAPVSVPALTGWQIGTGIRTGDWEQVGQGTAGLGVALFGVSAKPTVGVWRNQKGQFAQPNAPSARFRYEAWNFVKKPPGGPRIHGYHRFQNFGPVVFWELLSDLYNVPPFPFWSPFLGKCPTPKEKQYEARTKK
jgi:hypothetical protein